MVRPDWEKNIVTVALTSLKTPSQDNKEIKIATFGNDKYAAVYNTKTETLQILDSTGDRGALYKAKKGQPAEISNFSDSEKSAFLTMNKKQQAER